MGDLSGSANFIAGCVGLLQFAESYITFEVLGGDFLFLDIFIGNMRTNIPSLLELWKRTVAPKPSL
jgi:hypothetical protein